MGKKIEVLILDVEGFELEVLKGMIKSNFLPNLIVAETNQIGKNEFLKEINKIQKYKIILEYRNNTFYSKNEINFLKILYANLKVKTDSFYLKRIIKSFLPKNYRKNTKRKIINFLLGKNQIKNSFIGMHKLILNNNAFQNIKRKFFYKKF